MRLRQLIPYLLIPSTGRTAPESLRNPAAPSRRAPGALLRNAAGCLEGRGWVALWFLLACHFIPVAARAVDIFVPPTPQPFLLAIEPFRADPAGLGIPGEDIQTTRVQMTALLAKLTEMSGYFRRIDPDAHLERPENSGVTLDKIDFKMWEMITADFLVKGQIRFEGDELVAELRLFEVSTRAVKVGKQYRGKPEQWRIITRRFANAILEAISGVPGIFDTQIAYESRLLNAEGRNPKGIYIRYLDGEEPPTLIYQHNREDSHNPQWSPDRGMISFLCFSDPRAVYLYQLSSRLERKIRLGESQQPIAATWTPDGKSVAVTVNEGGFSDIILYDAFTLLPKGTVAKTWSNELEPSFTPDGKRVAFVSDRAGSPQVYLSDLDGKNLKRLTFDGRFNVSPRVSPDGRRIAWVHEEKESSDVRKDRVLSLWVMDMDGTNARRITVDTGHNEAPAWSPDGRYLIFQSDRNGAGKDQLYLMAADVPMMAVPLSTGETRDTRPSWGTAAQ